MRARRLPHGFTLVEIMIVVVIIGVLSSVAIPSYRNVQLRSRQAERGIMVTSIYRAIEDYWMREGRFPTDWGGGAYFLNLTNWNPNATPTPYKRAWRRTSAGDDWSKLSLQVDGDVFYSYYAYGYSLGSAQRYDLVYVLGNLDGDATQTELEKEWYFEGTRLIQYAGSSPADCTWQYEYPTNGSSF